MPRRALPQTEKLRKTVAEMQAHKQMLKVAGPAKVCILQLVLHTMCITALLFLELQHLFRCAPLCSAVQDRLTAWQQALHASACFFHILFEPLVVFADGTPGNASLTPP